MRIVLDFGVTPKGILSMIYSNDLYYQETEDHLVYPTVDDFVDLVKIKGQCVHFDRFVLIRLNIALLELHNVSLMVIYTLIQSR